jgi:Glycosyl hydrolase family 65 central catalytic domain/Glycosyl hydrolase family 65, N-terminal domain
MNAAPEAAAPEPDLPTALSRRFEAAIVDWSAVADRRGDMDVDRVDSRLGARPSGPGRLLLCGGGGATVEAGADGLVVRRQAGVDGVLADLWTRGIDPSGVLLAGVELLVLSGSEAARAVALERDPALIQRVLHDQRRRRRHGDVPTGIPATPWSLTIEGFDARFERVHESLLTLADGQLGTRGSPLVADGGTTPGVYLSGVYEGVGPATELARLRPWSRLDGGEDVRPSSRTLDLRAGVLYEDGPLRSIRFSSLARPRTVAMRVTGDDALLPSAGSRTDRGVVTAAFRDIRRDEVFERLGAYDPESSTAEEALAEAEDVGFEGLLCEHREAWAHRWEDADIVIDGDPESQRAVRFALFHLMASVADTGEAAVGARGLSGPAYRGHVFWDSDVFVLPFLAATHPAAARAMLE